jgi:endonuclease/exonuclease/phosphatase family metal-dependent hydrolase
MRFGLWNVHAAWRKPKATRHIPKLVAAFVASEAIDVFIAVEVGERAADIGKAIEKLGYTLVLDAERFAVYSRLPKAKFEELNGPIKKTRSAILAVTSPAFLPFLLVLVHGRDSRNSKIGTQTLVLRRIVNNVKWAEDWLGHKRTVVLGDFNANPFDEPILAADGLHAIMSKTEANRRVRKVADDPYEMFYRPMFRLIDQADDSPPATYFYGGSDTVEHFWHMLDQVVIRPDLIPYFESSSLRIMKRLGTVDLLDTSGRPNVAKSSDHLPLVFDIRLP